MDTPEIDEEHPDFAPRLREALSQVGEDAKQLAFHHGVIFLYLKDGVLIEERADDAQTQEELLHKTPQILLDLD